MKRFIIILLLLFCGLARAQKYPINDTLTTKIIYIGDQRDTSKACVKQDSINPMMLYNGARVWREKTFIFNYTIITVQGKPTLVNQGVFSGFSLPVYNSDNEELFACSCVPSDWDSTTNLLIYVDGWTPSTTALSKKFKLQVSVETADYSANEIVPATTNDYTIEITLPLESEAYRSFKSYVTAITSTVGIRPGFPLGIRIRRIAASSDEYAGEVIVEGIVVSYLSNRLGAP